MIDKFLDYLRHELNRAPLTIEAYHRDISQFSEWLGSENINDTDFCSVTSSDIRSWLASLARNGESSRTIRRKSQSLRALFRWMRKQNMIDAAPTRDIPLPKISKPLPDIVKPTDIEKLLSNSDGQEDINDPQVIMSHLIIEMLYSLGIRRAELLAIDDAHIYFDRSELKVTGKRSKQRVIPVPQSLLEKIKTWQKLRDGNDYPVKDSPLFVIKGKRISAPQIYRIVHKYLENTPAKKKSPHALRHSFASAMLNGGADIDSVREFLGHASLATTQIYTHISLKEIKKAYSSAHPRSSDSKK